MDIVKDSCFSHLKRHSRIHKAFFDQRGVHHFRFHRSEPAVLISSIPRLHAGIRLPIAFIRSHYVERRRDRDDELHPVKPCISIFFQATHCTSFSYSSPQILIFFVLFFHSTTIPKMRKQLICSKKCASQRTPAPARLPVRQRICFRASAHPQRSVFFIR